MNAQKFAEQVVQEAGLTGVGVGISTCPTATDGTSIKFAHDLGVAGMRRHRGSVPIALDDCWHIGSVGKSATAVLLASLFEHEFPQLDCTLPELLPHIDMHSGWSSCTLYHLLTSTSGLPPNFPLRKIFKNMTEHPRELIALRRQLIATALAKPPKTPCGSKFNYSNLGYTIAGHIAEVLTSRPYLELIEERVFAPMGLQRVGFGAPMGELSEDQPSGHRTILGMKFERDPFKVNADNPSAMSPAGRIHMSVRDLLLYGQQHLLGEQGHNSLLETSTWRLLHRPNLEEYGCGWVSQYKDWAHNRILWHNGSNALWYTLLVIIPTTQSVMAFVTNDGAIRKAEKIFWRVAQEHIESVG